MTPAVRRRVGRWLRSALLAAAPLAVLWPGLAAPFLFDDVPAVAENPYLRDPANVVAGWLRLHRPPVYVLHTIEYHFWGLRPAPFRLMNAAFHAAVALALYRLGRLALARLRWIRPAGPAAFWGALLFAVHPLPISTAWQVSARSDLMAAFFFLLSAARAVRFLAGRRGRDAAWATGWAALSLAAKPAAAGLLLAGGALALGLWKSPWRAAAQAAVVGLLALLLTGPFLTLAREVPLAEAWGGQTRAVPYYASLAAFPRGLRIDYDARPDDPGWEFRPFSVALVALAGALAARARGRFPPGFPLFVFFLASLAPTSLAPLPDACVPARAYLGTAAFTFLLAWGAFRIGSKQLLAAAAVLLTCASTALAARRDGAVSAWREEVRMGPAASRVRANFGEALRETGDLPRAIRSYRFALGLSSNDPLDRSAPTERDYQPLLNNLGGALLATGDAGGAILAFQKSYQSDPENPAPLFNLAGAFAARREWRAARLHAEGYLARRPGDLAGLNLLGTILARSGETEEARRQWAFVQSLAPGEPASLANLATLARLADRFDEAIRLYEAALVRGGDDPITLRNLLAAYRLAGREESAAALRARLARLFPDFQEPEEPEPPLWR